MNLLFQEKVKFYSLVNSKFFPDFPNKNLGTKSNSPAFMNLSALLLIYCVFLPRLTPFVPHYKRLIICLLCQHLNLLDAPWKYNIILLPCLMQHSSTEIENARGNDDSLFQTPVCTKLHSCVCTRMYKAYL